MADTKNRPDEQTHDCGLYPREISKTDVIEKMQAAGIPTSIELKTALVQHPGIGWIRNALDDAFGRAPALCQFPGQMLASLLPGPIAKWPGWYVRLPTDWAADMEHLLAAPGLYSHLHRAEQNPWHIAQWICLNGRPLPGRWPNSSRRIEVDDRYVHDTLIDGFAVRALVVLIECDTRLFTTALPIDECLICELQAGDSASSRHPLFDTTLAQVQGLAREVEDGHTGQSDPNVLRLPCIAMTNQSGASPFALGYGLREATHKRRHDVAISMQEDGAIGALAAVVNYLPHGCAIDDGLKLRLTMPVAAYDAFEREPLQVKVLKLEVQGDAQSLIAVVLTAGTCMYCAELPADDEELATGLEYFAKTGRCQLVLENLRNGRWHVVEIAWPSDCKSQSVDRHLAAPQRDILLRTEHPAILRLARTHAKQLGQSIELMRCVVNAVESAR